MTVRLQVIGLFVGYFFAVLPPTPILTSLGCRGGWDLSPHSDSYLFWDSPRLSIQ